VSTAGTVTVGIVGAGGVARRHAETLRGFPDVRIAAVADVDTYRAAELASRCSARAYPSFEAMLDYEALDAIYICVPPFAHGPPELAAVAAGLPMFVEKPVAIDLTTAESIAAAVRDNGIVTAVGYHWRYLESVDRARALVREHPPQLVVGYWLDATPAVDWWVVRERSGGQIVEQATHVLDLLRFIAGEVSAVYARARRCRRPDFPLSDIADVTAATLELENGAVGALVSTCLLGERHRAGLEVICDGAVVELSEALPGGPEPAKVLVDRRFIDAVAGGQNAIRATYADAVATQRLACAVAAAADDGAGPVAVGGVA
jgi:predicted dehydrogenase